MKANFIKITGEAATVAEALKLTGMDRQVISEPIYNPDMRIVDGYKRVGFRDATFAVTKDSYQIVQNSEAFGIMDDILGVSQAQIHAIGYDKEGARVFIQAKMPNSWEALKDDGMDNYLTISTTHDGSGSVKASFGSVRLKCNNQMTAFQKRGAQISIRHTATASQKIALAGTIMMEGKNTWDIIKENAMILASRSVGRDQTKAFFETLFPKSDVRDGNKTKREKAESLIESEIEGTAWGLYNAATDFFDHHSPTRGDGTDLTVRSILDGESFRNRAFELALAT